MRPYCCYVVVSFINIRSIPLGIRVDGTRGEGDGAIVRRVMRNTLGNSAMPGNIAFESHMRILTRHNEDDWEFEWQGRKNRISTSDGCFAQFFLFWRK